jgi:predicted helicase
MVNKLPDLNLQDAGAQSFPLFTYEKVEEESHSEDLFAVKVEKERFGGYTRNENISDLTLEKFRKAYEGSKGKSITKEDIFYYVYGIFHSPEYKKRFDSDLKKMLPRIPLAKDFWVFSKAGRELSNWHVNYESVEPYDLIQDGEIGLGDSKLFEITKVHFPKVNGKEDRTTIIYNNRIKLGGIPLEAYEYVVNGKSALEWVMERYQVSLDKDSGITNNPNEWCLEAEDPEYILNLIKRLVRVSVESVKIIDSLPKLDEVK